MPNARTAVLMGPCSATIEATNGLCEARSLASNSLVCTAAAPAALRVLTWSPSWSAFRAASTTVAWGARRRASSMPISLRPPRITTGPAPVSSTAAIIACASVSGDGEYHDPAHRRRAGVSHRTPPGHVDHVASRQLAACGGGRFHLRSQDTYRAGHHQWWLPKGCQCRPRRDGGAQPGRRRSVAVVG